MPPNSQFPIPTTQFTGFPPGGFDFFLELQARQSRDWFKANKQRFEELWQRPMAALLLELSQQLADVFPEIPNAHQHVFRIQRDTRFSADKSPYKTHIAGHIPTRPTEEGNWSVASVYVHFGLEENVAALGRWELDGEALQLFRKAIADEKTGATLQTAMDKLAKAGFDVSSHHALKRVPPPFPQDHPRAELLKLKGLAVGTPEVPEELMPSHDLVDWLADRFRQAAPIAHWLEASLKPGAK
jgi:uncharacterized protein (TIGR02453 family)